jgi:hypothetical protein
MRLFTRFLFLLALALIGIIIQEFHIVAINGVATNLLLVLFVVLIVLRESVSVLGLLGSALCGIAFIYTPFWLAPFFVLGAIFVLLFFLSRLLTGSRATDALLLVGVGTLAFSVVGALIGGTPFSFVSFGIELAMNLFVTGIVALFVFRNVPNVR